MHAATPMPTVMPPVTSGVVALCMQVVWKRLYTESAMLETKLKIKEKSVSLTLQVNCLIEDLRSVRDNFSCFAKGVGQKNTNSETTHCTLN